MRSIDRRGVAPPSACVALAFLIAGGVEAVLGQARPSHPDVVYATVAGRHLVLDLHGWAGETLR